MEMCTWRRLLRISRTERKNNEKILQIIEDKRILYYPPLDREAENL